MTVLYNGHQVTYGINGLPFVIMRRHILYTLATTAATEAAAEGTTTRSLFDESFSVFIPQTVHKGQMTHLEKPQLKMKHITS